MRFSRTLAVLAGLSPLVACASSLNGAELSGYWAIPFAGILLSLALCPMVVPNFWHHHYGKVAVCWALACAVPLFCVFGSDVAVPGIAHTLLADYIPFLLFVGALFVIAGGIHIRSTFTGRPVFNTCFLAVGAVLANLMGTTGAAMLLIRPLIHANSRNCCINPPIPIHSTVVARMMPSASLKVCGNVAISCLCS